MNRIYAILLGLGLLLAGCKGCSESVSDIKPVYTADGFRVPQVYSVLNYGAVPNDGASDRAAFEAAINALWLNGGYGFVWVPNGVYDVDQASSDTITLLENTTIYGQSTFGTIIRQMPGAGGSARVFTGNAGSKGVTITNLTVDGQRTLQTGGTGQRHGFYFNDSASGITLDGVRAINFEGDGGYIGTARNVLVVNSYFRDNGRNGFSLGAEGRDITLRNSEFRNNLVQQVDMEPGTGLPIRVENIVVSHCVIDGTGGAPYAISVGSSNPDSISHDILVTDNTITGGINVVWAKRVVVSRNVITAMQGWYGIRLYRTAASVVVAENTITMPDGGAVDELAGVALIGTSTQAQMPEMAIVVGNDITVNRVNTFGVYATAIQSLTVAENTLTGPNIGTGFGNGVYVRVTIANEPVNYLSITDNTIKGFRIYAITLTGIGTATSTFYQTQVSRNTFGNFPGSAYMTTAMQVDTGNATFKQQFFGTNTCPTPSATWGTQVACPTPTP